MHKSPTGPYLYQKETKVFHLIVTTNIRCDNEKKSSSSAANNQSALACKTINEISGRNKWQVHFQKLLSNNPNVSGPNVSGANVSGNEMEKNWGFSF